MNFARVHLLFLGIIATLYHLNSLAFNGIGPCEIFQQCLLQNITNSTLPPSDIDTNTGHSITAICFDRYFCECTRGNGFCFLNFYLFGLFDMMLLIAFCFLLVSFLCSNYTRQRRVLFEEANYRYWKRKMVVLVSIYVVFIILNLTLPTIICTAVYGRHSIYFDDIFANLPWICVAILSPSYLVFWTNHNAQFRRMVKISYLVTELETVPTSLLPDPDDDCCICLEPLAASTTVRTRCNHLFHLNCIREVIITTNTCPLCRATIVVTSTQTTERSDSQDAPTPDSHRPLVESV